jgi:hypothetical protein
MLFKPKKKKDPAHGAHLESQLSGGHSRQVDGKSEASMGYTVIFFVTKKNK